MATLRHHTAPKLHFQVAQHALRGYHCRSLKWTLHSVWQVWSATADPASHHLQLSRDHRVYLQHCHHRLRGKRRHCRPWVKLVFLIFPSRCHQCWNLCRLQHLLCLPLLFLVVRRRHRHILALRLRKRQPTTNQHWKLCHSPAHRSRRD